MINHVEFIEDIKHFIKTKTVIEGYCDIIEDELAGYKIENNDFYTLVGNVSSEQIDDVFKCSNFYYSDGINMEGVYSYTACLHRESSSWEEPSELYIIYIKFTLIETFEARDRNLKISEILGFDELF
jgi:hypothetical protein